MSHSLSWKKKEWLKQQCDVVDLSDTRFLSILDGKKATFSVKYSADRQKVERGMRRSSTSYAFRRKEGGERDG
jgi:hypothetical protein